MGDRNFNKGKRSSDIDLRITELQSFLAGRHLPSHYVDDIMANEVNGDKKTAVTEATAIPSWVNGIDLDHELEQYCSLPSSPLPVPSSSLSSCPATSTAHNLHHASSLSTRSIPDSISGGGGDSASGSDDSKAMMYPQSHLAPYFQFEVDSSGGKSSKHRVRRTRPISESIASKQGWEMPQRATAHRREGNEEERVEQQMQQHKQQQQLKQQLKQEKKKKAEDVEDAIIQRDIERMEDEVEGSGTTHSPTEEYLEGQRVYRQFMEQSASAQNTFDRAQSMLALRTQAGSFQTPQPVLRRSNSVKSPRRRQQQPQQLSSQSHDGSSEYKIETKYRKEFENLEREIANGRQQLRELQALVRDIDQTVDPVQEIHRTADKVVRKHRNGKTVVIHHRTGAKQYLYRDTDATIYRNGDIHMHKHNDKTVKWTESRKMLETKLMDQSTQLRNYIGFRRCELTLPDQTCVKLQKTNKGLYKILVYPENHASGREREFLFPSGGRKIEYAGGVIETVAENGNVQVRIKQDVGSDTDIESDNDGYGDSMDDDSDDE